MRVKTPKLGCWFWGILCHHQIFSYILDEPLQVSNLFRTFQPCYQSLWLWLVRIESVWPRTSVKVSRSTTLVSKKRCNKRNLSLRLAQLLVHQKLCSTACQCQLTHRSLVALKPWAFTVKLIPFRRANYPDLWCSVICNHRAAPHFDEATLWPLHKDDSAQNTVQSNSYSYLLGRPKVL